MTKTPAITGRMTPPPCCGWALALLAIAGCVTPWERSALISDKRAEIGSVQGPVERQLRGNQKERRKRGNDEEDGDNLLKPIAGTDEYEAAEKLYNDENYAAAEKAFKKVAKEFKKSEICEDAVFMEAEAAYAQERYAKAHDLYARVLKDYPTTRHLDKISNRLFKISMIWLDHPQVADMNEIQQVNHDKYGEKVPPKEPAKQSKRNVLVPNFTDKKRPTFDPHGNALSALRSIWTNDPTGPLADDALMLAASYYARSGEFIEADRHFTMLREQFPNSPHVQKAFELDAHVKLMSYQGSMYDGKMLLDAEQLKQATLRLYPEIESRERMETELKKIQVAKADRLWAMAVFYEGKGRKKAAAIYCHMLIDEYPNSPFAKKAETKLAQLGPGYADGRALLSPYPDRPITLVTSIFPPDDHGGIPQPSSFDPNAPAIQPAKYGSKFAMVKPPKNQTQSQNIASSSKQAPAKANPEPRQEKLGSRLALVKPPKDQAPQETKSKVAKPKDKKRDDANSSEDMQQADAKRFSEPNSSHTPPRVLPKIAGGAKPATPKKAKPAPAKSNVGEDDDETEAGHTRL